MMSQKVKKVLFTVGSILFIAGIMILLSAVNFGLETAQNAIQANGGTMATEEYYWIMQTNTLSFQLLGSILSVLGGLLTILTVFARTDK